MKRREFIGIAATGAAGLALPASGRDCDVVAVAILAAPRLIEVVHDPAIVEAIGRRYREWRPAETGGPALAAAILADVGAVAPADLAARVDDQVRRDFAGGRTVTLNGWVVAVTEARQCALYSLVVP